MKKPKLRLTYSETEGFWLHVSGTKSAGVHIGMFKNNIARAALMEAAEKAKPVRRFRVTPSDVTSGPAG